MARIWSRQTSNFVSALLALLTFSGAQSQKQQLVLYSTSWEPGESAETWTTLVRDWGCPCPVVTFDFASTGAARTGAYGIAVNITTELASDGAWGVQLKSQAFELSASQAYSACIWVRTTIAGGAALTMNLVTEDGHVWATISSGEATTEWQQMCLPSFKPTAKSAVYHYTLDLGLLAGAVFVDDFSLAAVGAIPRSAVVAARVSSSSIPAADDANNYFNQTNVAARINTYRKGNFSIQFVKKSTDNNQQQQQALAGTRIASLKLRLAMHDFPFGSAMEMSSIPSANLSWYLDTAKKHFNALVPENGFKWPSYEPTQGNYSNQYSYILNSHIKFAAANDFVLARGHTLEWYTADAAFAKHWSRQKGCANYRDYLYTRITREVTAFKGMFKQYDVFNEVVHKLDFIQNCPGMWPSILYDGFRWAAAADPTAQLCLNDYGLITADDWPQFVQLVKNMKAAKVPIHCIGVQAYIMGWTPGRPTPRYMKPRLEALAALNLSMVISEYNFWTSWNSSGPAWAGTESEHAALHDEYVRFWFSLPYIKGILMWGFWDGRSWVKNGGIYHLNGTAKASANTVSKLWSSTWNTSVSETNFVLPSTALYGPYNGFYGKYYYEAMIGDRRYSGYVRFPASGGAEQTATVYI